MILDIVVFCCDFKFNIFIYFLLDSLILRLSLQYQVLLGEIEAIFHPKFCCVLRKDNLCV